MKKDIRRRLNVLFVRVREEKVSLIVDTIAIFFHIGTIIMTKEKEGNQ